jgi:hypothetical protein
MERAMDPEEFIARYEKISAAPIEDVSSQPDRVVAIVEAAYLEDRLRGALQSRMLVGADGKNSRHIRRMFEGAGPLATFSAKIDLGVLLGLYEDQVGKILEAITVIRNKFAHKSETLTFESEALQEWGDKLRFRYAYRGAHSESKLRDRYRATTRLLSEMFIGMEAYPKPPQLTAGAATVVFTTIPKLVKSEKRRKPSVSGKQPKA